MYMSIAPALQASNTGFNETKNYKPQISSEALNTEGFVVVGVDMFLLVCFCFVWGLVLFFC